ncbi:hypothetical protein FA95DRAFT_518697 [Auriscalpium vulgare]|uniref:Uncharacterized protein n=1 Tax=Auriscalpium vulgare TaxID=40419 RepID=A0ACB8S3U5_9AGAM|nr:hypothetical protein FA95DRAFT_518697 [Auriscalpium vulgare]
MLAWARKAGSKKDSSPSSSPAPQPSPAQDGPQQTQQTQAPPSSLIVPPVQNSPINPAASPKVAWGAAATTPKPAWGGATSHRPATPTKAADPAQARAPSPSKPSSPWSQSPWDKMKAKIASVASPVLPGPAPSPTKVAPTPAPAPWPPRSASHFSSCTRDWAHMGGRCGLLDDVWMDGCACMVMIYD